MTETISPTLQLRALRLVLQAPENYQREIRGRMRKLLLVAESAEQAEDFVTKYLDKIESRMQNSLGNRGVVDETTTTSAESGGEKPLEKQHRSEDEEDN